MASIFPSPGQNFALLGLSLCLLSQVCPILPSWLTVPSCSISTQQDRLVRSGFGAPGGDGSAPVENNRPAVCFRGIAFSWMRFAFQSVKGLGNLLIQKCGSGFEEGKENPATVVGGRGLSGPGSGLQLQSCWGKLTPVAFLIPWRPSPCWRPWVWGQARCWLWSRPQVPGREEEWEGAVEPAWSSPGPSRALGWVSSLDSGL